MKHGHKDWISEHEAPLPTRSERSGNVMDPDGSVFMQLNTAHAMNKAMHAVLRQANTASSGSDLMHLQRIGVNAKLYVKVWTRLELSCVRNGQYDLEPRDAMAMTFPSIRVCIG